VIRLQDGISVIICCYNSASRLAQTLKHLAFQKIPGEISWEIILVNNASNDNTTDIAENEWLKYNLSNVSFNIVDELKPGLSNAKEKGIKASKFEYCIFCDDDNWLDENYIKLAYYKISKNSQIAALGGQSTAVSTTNFPNWFESSKNNYAVGKQANNSGNISYRKYLWGSGIVIRRELYIKAFSNFTYVLGGRKGNELTSGEDSEMCLRFILMGYQLYYSEDLKFKHFIPEERLTIKYNERLMEGFLRAYPILNVYSRLIDIRSYSFKKKYISLIKPFIRILIVNTIHIKRWNVDIEKLNIYLISGYKFVTINKDIVKIKELSKNKPLLCIIDL
jgi:glycosyltransferase involved in cell wall biosynthesis